MPAGGLLALFCRSISPRPSTTFERVTFNLSAFNPCPQVEVCLRCSAVNGAQAIDVFAYALNAVLYPVEPLFDRATSSIKPACIKALLRVFMMCDADGDGQLSDAELNAFQVGCLYFCYYFDIDQNYITSCRAGQLSDTELNAFQVRCCCCQV